VIIDASLQVVGEGGAGPSNPLRVGVAAAAAAIRDAVDKACSMASIDRDLIAAACVGLAGIRRKDVRARMSEALNDALEIDRVELCTDGEIALYGATDGHPGLVVIAGTGSICCGMNGQGKRVCAGGWGPLVGDEGGGSWIARRALQAVARAADQRGPETSLTMAASSYFHVASPNDLSTAIYAPTMTNDCLAGFGKWVVRAAQAGDRVAHEIVTDAGRELGITAAAVIRRLCMERERFPVAYVGGVFAAGELVLKPLRETVLRVSKKAFLAPPLLSPAVAAARMARGLVTDLAIAV
jgi:N-acetylglucosamine kinase-like BadF-type ATPase